MKLIVSSAFVISRKIDSGLKHIYHGLYYKSISILFLQISFFPINKEFSYCLSANAKNMFCVTQFVLNQLFEMFTRQSFKL